MSKGLQARRIENLLLEVVGELQCSVGPRDSVMRPKTVKRVSKALAPIYDGTPREGTQGIPHCV